jgi:guanyl-specific ribonuclease Sa
MKSQTTMTLAAAVLLAGATLAVVSLSLSSQQQQTAWTDLNGAKASNAPSSFQPATSSAVPSTLTVHAIPAKTASAVPALRPYDYAKVDGKLLIVNPHDMMIAEVIVG